MLRASNSSVDPGFLSTSLLTKLESFQANIGKRILNLAKSTTKIILRMALQLAVHQSTHPVHQAKLLT